MATIADKFIPKPGTTAYEVSQMRKSLRTRFSRKMNKLLIYLEEEEKEIERLKQKKYSPDFIRVKNDMLNEMTEDYDEIDDIYDQLDKLFNTLQMTTLVMESIVNAQIKGNLIEDIVKKIKAQS